MTKYTDIIAIIPARGGSKRLPRKNLMTIGGQPLIVHTLRHAAESKRIGKTYVSTDDTEIARIAREHGADVIERPTALAGDDATSESALLHTLDERKRSGLNDPQLVVFLQCTSPIRGEGDIDGAITALEYAGADSLFSGSDNKRHIWSTQDRKIIPLNYDFRNRQREQDMPQQYNEDGSICIFKPAILRHENNRLGQNIAVYEMGPWREYQLDTKEDAQLIDWILQRPEFSAPIPWPDRIEMVVFDFDGVMTDNTVFTSQDGQETVRVHRGDGWGIQKLRALKIPILVLSTELNPVTKKRCEKLNIECIHGVTDKSTKLLEILTDRQIKPAHTIYLGNDENDLGCLQMVGLPVAVADAHNSILAHVRLTLRHAGGHGAVRELCDLIMARCHQRTQMKESMK